MAPHESQPNLETTLDRYLRTLAGRNRSQATITAYRTDIGQFVRWLRETNITVESSADVKRIDVIEYLAHLSERGLSGVSRARKLAAIREFYRWLTNAGAIERSPVAAIDTPKRERKSRTYLTPKEHNKLLAAAGAHPRDFCILTLFIQTGIRISELCELRLSDIDLDHATLTVRLEGV